MILGEKIHDFHEFTLNFLHFHDFHVKFEKSEIFAKILKFYGFAISSIFSSPAQKPYKHNAFSCVSGVHLHPFSGKHGKYEKVQKLMKLTEIS